VLLLYLQFLVWSGSEGFQNFHSAMIQEAASKRKKRYWHAAHWFDSNNYEEEMRSPVLNLFDIALQHSFLTKGKMDELFEQWKDKDCGICEKLTTLSHDLIAKQILEAFWIWNPKCVGIAGPLNVLGAVHILRSRKSRIFEPWFFGGKCISQVLSKKIFTQKFFRPE